MPSSGKKTHWRFLVFSVSVSTFILYCYCIHFSSCCCFCFRRRITKKVCCKLSPIQSYRQLNSAYEAKTLHSLRTHTHSLALAGATRRASSFTLNNCQIVRLSVIWVTRMRDCYLRVIHLPHRPKLPALENGKQIVYRTQRQTRCAYARTYIFICSHSHPQAMPTLRLHRHRCCNMLFFFLVFF